MLLYSVLTNILTLSAQVVKIKFTNSLTVVRFEGGEGVEAAVMKLMTEDQSLDPAALWA